MGVTYGNSFYTVVDGPSWTNAKKNAEALGGKLASITSEQEFKYLYENNVKGWIGLSDPKNTGPTWNKNNFTWESGEKYQFES